MSVTPSPIGGFAGQFFDNNGNPLSGGKVYTYAAGTTTPLAAYTTLAGNTPHTNPIILDSAGRVPGGEIWLTLGVGYKFVIETSAGLLIGTYDNVPSAAAPPAANDADSIMYEQGYLVTAGSFVAGKTYRIVSVGSTNFTAIGASANLPGVHFIATGAGTGTGTAELSQTVEEKLRQYVSVKDFGAVGDNVTNDTAAFQAAIDYGLENSRAIYVPSGDYLITAPLFINGTRGSGNQATFKMFGEIASDAVTHSNGLIVSRTNINFTGLNTALFKIHFDDFFFESLEFTDFTVRTPFGHASSKTSIGFDVEKNTSNYASKLQWLNINCYNMKGLARFFRTAGDPSSAPNYFGPTYFDRCNSYNTEYGIKLQNVNLNLLYIDRCMIHAALTNGGIWIDGSGTLLNMRNTHFEGCEPAGFNFTTSNWSTSLGLDNVSAESTGKISGYGYIKPYIPTFGYSALRVYVSNFLYPPAFMPEEYRLPYGATIASQCPVKVSGYGWIAETPETIIPVVSNDATFNQTDKSTFFIIRSLSTAFGRAGQRVIEKSIAGQAFGVGRSPVSTGLPTGLRDYCVGVDSNALIQNNVEGATSIYDGYVYGSFTGEFTDANNGFVAAEFLIDGLDIDIPTGFQWEPFIGTVVFMAPIENGQAVTNIEFSVFQSVWRTPMYMTIEPQLLTAQQAATVFPKKNLWGNAISNGATNDYIIKGQVNQEYSVRVRFTFNAGASGIYEYIVRGDGTTAGRTYITTINSVAAGITVSIYGFPSDADLYGISIANATGSQVAVTIENEYLS
jgi:hypothetical protein